MPYHGRLARVSSSTTIYSSVGRTLSLLLLGKQTFERHAVVILFLENVVRELLAVDFLPLLDELTA
jgi:hypothetical protein